MQAPYAGPYFSSDEKNNANKGQNKKGPEGTKKDGYISLKMHANIILTNIINKFLLRILFQESTPNIN